jgi:GMP synthase-like glutamine amidotransferase
MRLLIFQHSLAEDVGSFTRHLAAEGIAYDRVIFRKGDTIPDLDRYDALWALGGAMDVWDVEEFPWLIEEKRAIRRFVGELGRPFLGICLGHQLLADAMGGTCGPMKPRKDVGPRRVELNAGGQSDPLFAGFAPDFLAMQWHSVCVAQLPEGGETLAGSDVCCCEAMRFGPRAWGVQFHPELWQPTLDRWRTSESAVAALDAYFGPGGFDRLTQLCRPWLDDFNANARRMLRNFLTAMERPRLAA